MGDKSDEDDGKEDKEDETVEIDDKKLFIEKMDNPHKEPAKQKKPDGRKKSRDIKDETELEYRQDIYKNRDKKGL